MNDIDNLSEYTIAPQHALDLKEVDPYIIEGVAYSPLKVTHKSSSHDESLIVCCNNCEWQTTIGQLPKDGMYVQPDMCPDCAKKQELGFVRCQSPADRTLPSGWSV
jgi:hypothetical protein